MQELTWGGEYNSTQSLWEEEKELCHLHNSIEETSISQITESFHGYLGSRVHGNIFFSHVFRFLSLLFIFTLFFQLFIFKFNVSIIFLCFKGEKKKTWQSIEYAHAIVLEFCISASIDYWHQFGRFLVSSGKLTEVINMQNCG